MLVVLLVVLVVLVILFIVYTRGSQQPSAGARRRVAVGHPKHFVSLKGGWVWMSLSGGGWVDVWKGVNGKNLPRSF